MDKKLLIVQSEDNTTVTIELQGKVGYAIVGTPPAFVRVWDDKYTYVISPTRFVFLAQPNPKEEKSDG